MGIKRQLQRKAQKDTLLEKKKEDIEKAKNHPTAIYMNDMMTELEGIYARHPEIATLYKVQIEQIRKKHETDQEDSLSQKKKITNEIIAKTQALLETVEDDFRDKSVWLLMKAIERELHEIRNIATNAYGEENETNIKDTTE